MDGYLPFAFLLYFHAIERLVVACRNGFAIIIVCIRILVFRMPKKHAQSNKTRKRKGKDIDEIHEDLRPEKAAKLLNQEIDLDLPGDAQFYCIECERYFQDDKVLQLHKRSKPHKQTLRRLKEVPYSIAEAESAGGVGVVPMIKNLTPGEVTKINKVWREGKKEEVKMEETEA